VDGEHHAEKRAHRPLPRGGAHLQEPIRGWLVGGEPRLVVGVHVSAARTRPAAHDAPGCATHRPDGVSHPVEDEAGGIAAPGTDRQEAPGGGIEPDAETHPSPPPQLAILLSLSGGADERGVAVRQLA